MIASSSTSWPDAVIYIAFLVALCFIIWVVLR